jgi:NosR/NirI family nitrous oxide reductase transcriptional regulator
VDSAPSSPFRRRALHAYRVGVFLLLLFLIHQQHAWHVAQRRGEAKQPVALDRVRSFYPQADHLSDWDPAHGGQNVLDANGETLGHVVQTSPEADDVVGFSGPTNTLVAFDKSHRIVGVAVLRSDDTREHLGHILKNDTFFQQWNGLGKDDAAANPEIDAVSGATLTSQAIADSIATRFGGQAHESRFPNEIAIDELRKFLPAAASFEPVADRPHLQRVLDAAGQAVGYASRTSPHADHLIGYQGPSDVLLVFDPAERFIGLGLRGTFDNAPYVKLMTDDEYFFNSFVGFDLADVAKLDMVDAGIDGVTGATKTSVTVAESIIQAAMELVKVREPASPRPWFGQSPRDLGTGLVVLISLAIAFTRLRGIRWLRWAHQALLIGYLGFINADMLSLAQFVGWAQNGVSWRVATGLVLLTAAALIAPIFTGRQVYCTHLCPYGAAQDWLHRRLPWRISIKGPLDTILSALPIALLAAAVFVAMGHLPFSLVWIEPFDAFVFRIAGWATIAIAITGLIASLFVTRAYCRYGCPTGALLKYLRWGGNAAPDRFGRRDWVAAAIVLLALGMSWLR